jgi:hypothetical protein
MSVPNVQASFQDSIQHNGVGDNLFVYSVHL